MGHKVLVGGTSYEIKGGKTLIDGTAYSVIKGRTMIGGAGYDINFSNVPPFSDCDWAAIKQIAESGDAPTMWSVGDEKQITLTTGEIITVQIAGFDHDLLYTGASTLPITLIMKNCLNTTYAMNSASTNSGGWNTSNVRSVLSGTMFNQLPSDLKSVIAYARKLAADNTGAIVNCTDRLWIPSEIEVFGVNFFSYSGEGTQYSIFANSANRIKKVNGTAFGWHERSPKSGSTTSFCKSGQDGVSSYGDATASLGIVFGFCI